MNERIDYSIPGRYCAVIQCANEPTHTIKGTWSGMDLPICAQHYKKVTGKEPENAKKPQTL